MNRKNIRFLLIALIAISAIIYDSFFATHIHQGKSGSLSSLLFPFLILGLLILKKKAMNEKEKWEKRKDIDRS